MEFGPAPEVEEDGRQVPLGGEKQRALLALLLLSWPAGLDGPSDRRRMEREAPADRGQGFRSTSPGRRRRDGASPRGVAVTSRRCAGRD
jgi:hypothetical protein